MKVRKKKYNYLWISMSDDEIFAYSPVFYTDLRDALDALHSDISDIAKRNHYKADAVMVLSVKALEDRVNVMWKGWTDVNEETETGHHQQSC